MAECEVCPASWNATIRGDIVCIPSPSSVEMSRPASSDLSESLKGDSRVRRVRTASLIPSLLYLYSTHLASLQLAESMFYISNAVMCPFANLSSANGHLSSSYICMYADSSCMRTMSSSRSPRHQSRTRKAEWECKTVRKKAGGTRQVR